MVDDYLIVARRPDRQLDGLVVGCLRDRKAYVFLAIKAIRIQMWKQLVGNCVQGLPMEEAGRPGNVDLAESAFV